MRDFPYDCVTVDTYGLIVIEPIVIFVTVSARFGAIQIGNVLFEVIIYIIIRDCTRVGAFPRAFCVPNSVALASLTLQVVYWAIH